MKKLVFIVLTMAFFGCVPEKAEMDTGRKSFTRIEFGMEDAFSTRTTTNSYSPCWISWEEGDRIGLFSDIQEVVPYDYQGTCLDVDRWTEVSSFTGPLMEGSRFYAYYPYEGCTVDPDNRYLIHHFLQGCLAGPADERDGIIPLNAPMGALESDGSQYFMLTCGALNFCVTLRGERILGIEFKGNGNEQLYGPGTFDLQGDAPCFVLDGSSNPEYARYVQSFDQPYELPDGETLSVTFLLPPMTFNHGITLTVRLLDKEGREQEYRTTTDQAITVSRAQVVSFRNYAYDGGQREALAALYEATGGDNWNRKENWCTDRPLFYWDGVQLEGSSYVVQVLHLSGNNLTGSLPPELVKLTGMSELRFDGNHLTGKVPDEYRTWLAWRCGSWANAFYGNNDLDIWGSVLVPEFDVELTDGSRYTNEDVLDNELTILCETTLLEAQSRAFDVTCKQLYDLFHDRGLEILSWYQNNDNDNIYQKEELEDVRAYYAQNGYGWKAFMASKDNGFECVYPAKQSCYPEYGMICPFPQIEVFDKHGEMVWTSFQAGYEDLVHFVKTWYGESDYASSDYSRDGHVTVLQQASSGNGIDLVFMGDGYSDRQIADGTYETALRKACENFFAIEPYRSFRNLFNVYAVDVVSRNEGFYSGARTGLEAFFTGGTGVEANEDKVFRYASKAVDVDSGDVTVHVVLNSSNYAGVTHMFDTAFLYGNPNGDYGRGNAVSYSSDHSMLSDVIVRHEAGGHGFAKLLDEYISPWSGEIWPELARDYRMGHSYGWYRNVDFTSDPSAVLWAPFISDPRYEAEGLGVYEGGANFEYGIWRPTESSLMSSDETKGFNAPSREAIYYRIHKLAYGSEWVYDREQFIEYDAVNRQAAASAPRRAPGVEKAMPPLAPPVVKPWPPKP